MGFMESARFLYCCSLGGFGLFFGNCTLCRTTFAFNRTQFGACLCHRSLSHIIIIWPSHQLWFNRFAAHSVLGVCPAFQLAEKRFFPRCTSNAPN